MDMSRALKFVFEDEEWVAKIAIGALIGLIPLIGQIIILGYMAKLARNVAQGNPRPLPRWDDFGDLLTRGLYVFAIMLAYVLPGVLLMFLAMVPVIMAGDAAGGRGDSVAGGLALCLFPLVGIVSLVLGLASYGAIARYVSSNQLSEAFKIGAVFANLRANLGTWLMLLLTAIVASLLGTLISTVTCGLGFLVVPIYMYSVLGHCIGQILQREQAGGPYVNQPYPPVV